jgi:Ca2+-binding RTX toxin-like protein
MTFSFQWLRCPLRGTACVAISLATRSTYVVAAADVAKRLRLRVTAANVAGSTPALSAITARIAATAPPTVIRGTARADRLVGTARGETIRGGAGNDRIDGRAGNDTLYGEAGNDTIIGGAGRDKIFGGAGNDTISAADKAIDTIDCGAGRDSVTADRNDVVKNCERVTRR